MTTGVTAEELPPPAYALGHGALDHALTSSPFPLQASHADAALNRADLDLVISAAPGQPVLCRGLVIELPMGTTAQALVESAEGISLTLSDDFWDWSLQTTESAVRCLLTTQDDGFFFDEDGLTIQLRNLGINRAHGAAHIRVFEDHEPMGQHTAMQPVTLVVEKAPFRPEIDAGSPNRFSVHRYSGSGADTAPATLVTAGSRVTLRWQHRQDVQRHLFWQYLHADDSAPGTDVSHLTRIDTQPLQRATTFTLRTRDESTGETTYDTVTVQVDSPTLAGLALTGPLSARAGALILTGPVTAQELVAEQGLSAKGVHVSTMVGAQEMTADADVTIDGPLRVSGAIEVPGDVEVQHITTANLTAKNSVRMLRGPRQANLLDGHPVTAQTDGFYAGQMGNNPTNPAPFSFTLKVNGDERSITAATGSNHVMDTVFMPVLRGETMTLHGTTGWWLTSHLFWVPFGG